MSGISSGVGVFSGIDSKSIIDQLMALEARPRTLAQQRLVQIKSAQAAYLDLNSRINAIKTAAAKFRTDSTFKKKAAVSSDESVLTATASITAASGSHTFRVDRLVSSQQMLSRGFADRDSSAFGAGSFTFESAAARLDRDVALADFNNGSGIARGTIQITDSGGGSSTTVDLSRATTVQDVLDAINESDADVTASVSGGRFVIRDNAGGSITIANGSGYTTADSLGIAGTATGAISGQSVYALGTNTALSSLNDGNGVYIKRNPIDVTAHSFTIQVAGSTNAAVDVNLGDVYTGSPPTKSASAVTTIGQAIDRINAALTAAGATEISARLNADEGRIELVDSTNGANAMSIDENGATTAADLGLVGNGGAGNFNGRRIFAGLQTVLTRSLNGGSGMAGDGVVNFTLRDGSTFSATLSGTTSLNDIFSAVEQASGTLAGGGSKVSVSLNDSGTGLKITDNTTGTGNLIITGTSGSDSAASLGIATGATGVAAGTFSGTNAQKAYMSLATRLSTFKSGAGVGTGKIRFTDSGGATRVVDIGTDAKSVGDVIEEINASMEGTGGTTIRARINAKGDGIEIYDTGTGTLRIKVEDQTGSVAAALGIKGEATGTDIGALNHVDGSQEKTVTIDADDTLDDVVSKINEAGAGVDAAVVRDGSGTAPFRLNLTSERTGTAGRFAFDGHGFDLGMRTLSKGDDALAFFGGGDVANAIAVSSSSNLLDNILPGVKVDLKSVSENPVTLTINADNEAIKTDVEAFVTAFNDAISRINVLTHYDPDTQQKGQLLGDGTVNELKSSMYRALNVRAKGYASNYDQLVDVGLKVARDGTISIDDAKLQAAIAADPAAVENLFTRRTAVNDATIDLGNGITATNPNAGTTFGEMGAMAQIEQAMDKYVNSISGVLSAKQKGFDTQILTGTKRIDAMTARLDVRRGILERQFAAMESTIGKLQTQQGSLGSLAQLAG